MAIFVGSHLFLNTLPGCKQNLSSGTNLLGGEGFSPEDELKLQFYVQRGYPLLFPNMAG